MQLLQWMISFITGSSAGTGWGGTRLIPAIMGLIGVMIPKLGSKPCMQMDSEDGKVINVYINLLLKP